MKKKLNEIRVIGVAKPETQKHLKAFQLGEDQIHQVWRDQRVIIIESNHEILHVGQIDPKDEAFLNSLHNPPLSATIIGGGYIIYNESNQEEKRVGDLTELPEDQQILIMNSIWRAQKIKFGLELEPLQNH